MNKRGKRIRENINGRTSYYITTWIWTLKAKGCYNSLNKTSIVAHWSSKRQSAIASVYTLLQLQKEQSGFGFFSFQLNIRKQTPTSLCIFLPWERQTLQSLVLFCFHQRKNGSFTANSLSFFQFLCVRQFTRLCIISVFFQTPIYHLPFQGPILVGQTNLMSFHILPPLDFFNQEWTLPNVHYYCAYAFECLPAFECLRAFYSIPRKIRGSYTLP